MGAVGETQERNRGNRERIAQQLQIVRALGCGVSGQIDSAEPYLRGGTTAQLDHMSAGDLVVEEKVEGKRPIPHPL